MNGRLRTYEIIYARSLTIVADSEDPTADKLPSARNWGIRTQLRQQGNPVFWA
jgi:hypothetical protein